MSSDPVILGTRESWGTTEAFSLSDEDRKRHLYIVGKTGTGKSTLLSNTLLQLIHRGSGCCLIDPHGELCDAVLARYPSARADALCVFDPADTRCPVGLNPLANVVPDRRHLVVSGIVNAFKGIWSDSWGPRLEMILSMTIGALTYCPDATLLASQRMLVDEAYRRHVLRQVDDDLILQFWNGEFASWTPSFRAEAIQPVSNKLSTLLLSEPLRLVLGQVRPKFDPRYCMDHGRVLLANLSVGRLGAQASSLMGALLLTMFQTAAMERADVPEHERVDFTLVLDELQRLVGSPQTLENAMSEARKFNCSYLLCHQFIEQLPKSLLDAVLGNCGSMISFRVSDRNAQVLAAEFGGDFLPSTYTSLANFEVMARVLAGGVQRDPFLGRTLPPAFVPTGRSDTLRRRSSQSYGRPGTAVADKLARWMRHAW